ncbi:MAG: hypothetical protein U0230_14705 [Polyangiales bacterium]
MVPGVEPGRALYVLGLPIVGTERLDPVDRDALLEPTRARYVASKLSHLGRWTVGYVAVAGALAACARELAAGAELGWAIATGVFVALGAVAAGGGLVEVLFPATRLSRAVLVIGLSLGGAGAYLESRSPSDAATALLVLAAATWLMIGVGTFLARFLEHPRHGTRLGRAIVDLEAGVLAIAEGRIPDALAGTLPEHASTMGLDAGRRVRVAVLPLSRFVVALDGHALGELVDLPSVEVAVPPSAPRIGDAARADAANGAGRGARSLTDDERREVRRISVRELRRSAVASVGAAMTVHELAPFASLLSFVGSTPPSEAAVWGLTVLAFGASVLVRLPTSARLLRDARRGEVSTRRGTSTPYGPAPLEEVLPSSRLVWTVEGRPGPDRLVADT